MKIFLLSVFVTLSSAQCQGENSIAVSGINKCLRIIGPGNFDQARRTCNSLGGSLLRIRTGMDQSFIQLALTARGINGNFWIGLTFGDVRGWHWIDGAQFSPFMALPRNPGIERCICFHHRERDPYVRDACDQFRPSLCELPLNLPTVVPPQIDRVEPHFQTTETVSVIPCTTAPPVSVPTCSAQKPVCDSEWTFFSKTNSCYKLFRGRADFPGAQEHCEKQNSNLTSIHSDEENSFLFEMATTGIPPTSDFTWATWIGLRRTHHQFQWVDGTEFDFQNWAGGRPDNNVHGISICGQLVSDAITQNWPDWLTQWNDVTCHIDLRAFICKKAVNMS